MSDPRIIVALDLSAADSALALAQRLSPELCRLKVGKELFTAAGPALVAELVRSGFGVFLDLKFHDIPNTVAQACRSAARLGVWMIDVHALGGRVMLQAAREALGSTLDRPRLTAVTILTSLDAAGLREVGIEDTPARAASRLAGLAQASGVDGVVCSAQEAAVLRRQCGAGFLLVTPGIRSADPGGADALDDQKRIASARSAVDAGADYLVIGRPVTRAADPLAALRRIHAEISA
ncbi:MAG TPA: orotidine-5'-phosphate decarboxylase [Burkholderiales bacterium]|nr:orotidine-5'-phosphate decarboxylase [Burkholderiales bacterium]